MVHIPNARIYKVCAVESKGRRDSNPYHYPKPIFIKAISRDNSSYRGLKFENFYSVWNIIFM